MTNELPKKTKFETRDIGLAIHAAPGPWKYHLNVGPTKALIVEADGSTIAEIRNNVHDSRFEANVRVMTAGRELLKALKALKLECLSDPLNPCWDGRHNDVPGQHWGSVHGNTIRACSSCVARAAIASAEGARYEP